jgi:Fe-S-cluster-containing dehydrogenase component
MPPVGNWRRLLEDGDAAAEMFPSLAAGMQNPLERRRLLRMMAASMALGGLAGCQDPSTPATHWMPAVIAAPGIIPGIPNHYATAASTTGGPAIGLVVTHQMGRPIKVEGNPKHPASLGATDAQAQALILDFYDPDRSGSILHAGELATGDELLMALVPERDRLFAARGKGLRILTGTCWSPTLGRTMDALLKRLPEARWVQWEPVSRDAAREGSRLAYGRYLDLVPKPEAADVILGLESDLVSSAPGHVALARGFAARRNPAFASMSRVYAAESVPTLLGSQADHRFAATPSDMHAALMALAAGVLGGEGVAGSPPWVPHALADLKAAPGRALIHAGPDLAPEAHALVHAMNEALGGRGKTYDLVEPVEYRPEDQGAGMAGLVRDMGAGGVDTLLILDANPVYAVPGFEDLLKQVRLSVHTAAAPDETAQVAGWHVPMAHAFETWGDLRAHDGTAAIVQPQALPLHGGQSPLELLSLLLDAQRLDPIEAVRETWKDKLGDEASWVDAVADGVVPGTASAVASDSLRAEAGHARPPAPPKQALTVLVRPDPMIWDGRHANNPWLQEAPRPFAKTAWDNPLHLAADVEPGAKDGQVVELRARDVLAETPAWRLPGLAPGCAVAFLGWGRLAAGAVGTRQGWNAFPLRTVLDGGTAPSLTLTDRHHQVATSDRGMGQSDPVDIVRRATLAQFQANPALLQGETPSYKDSLYHQELPGPAAWGMVVDLNSCIGCNACVVACQAENNVPVVGRENMLKQREMHWLRIDRYWDGEGSDAQALFEPMLCHHCEMAPCETVCPVEASVHDSEGLNVQVYNRCVGTRFCSNNCPYKVRRFNFGPYANEETRPAISRNPQVSVRGRGVMEKCTFCLQRIAEARVRHDVEGVPEDTVTACQSACPTNAFHFGNMNIAGSDVVARKHSPLNYVLLPEQQTHPRLTFEGRVRNANPALVETKA